MSEARAAVILAAGQGTRMKSSLVKVLHPVAGRPMVRWIVDAAREAGCDPVVVVVGFQGDAVRDALADVPGVAFAEQAQQRGTGDAVRSARAALEGFAGTVVILPGDVPLLPADVVSRLAGAREQSGAAVTVLYVELDEPGWYGRLVRGDDGGLRAIVEARDAGAQVRAIREINTGVYAVDGGALFGAGAGAAGLLQGLDDANAQGELYLTDIVAGAVARGLGAEAVVHPEPDDVIGINDRVALAAAEVIRYGRLARRWMRAGVTIHAPETARIDAGVELGRDVEIGPGVQLRGATRIEDGGLVDTGAILTDCTAGTGARVGVGCVLERADLAAGVQVRPYTVMNGVDEKRPETSGDAQRVRVGRDAQVGPFAHLRPATELGERVHLGNFVETKMTTMGEGAKANHLAYLGDGEIGARSNVGAGVIFCNYDGTRKNRTIIGEDAFVGSDSQLVAPVRVGDRAYVGSGTTLTQDVDDGALIVTRARAKVIHGAGDRKAEQARRKKQGGGSGGETP